MIRRLTAIMRKEFIHILRDWRSLFIVILMPVLMIALYGYAITLDLRNITFGVVDDARTPESRELVEHFTRNGFFVLTQPRMEREEVMHHFMRRNVQMVLVIPSDFSAKLISAADIPVQVLIDATDANVGQFINNYANRVVRLFNEGRYTLPAAILTLEPRILYNPDMKSTNFFVPALIAMILMLISALLTSITITREKESGTLEQILVSPIHPMEILIGKVIPYIFLGFVNCSMILLFAWILFRVPVHGSLLLVGLFSLVYIFTALSFGLLISTVARSQQIAMLLTLLATILPTIMLSGFLFPIASMPLALRWLSKVIPATYYLVIIRGIMLKGIGIPELWQQVATLGGIGLLIITIAIRRFHTNLEG